MNSYKNSRSLARCVICFFLAISCVAKCGCNKSTQEQSGFYGTASWAASNEDSVVAGVGYAVINYHLVDNQVKYALWTDFDVRNGVGGGSSSFADGSAVLGDDSEMTSVIEGKRPLKYRYRRDVKSEEDAIFINDDRYHLDDGRLLLIAHHESDNFQVHQMKLTSDMTELFRNKGGPNGISLESSLAQIATNNQEIKEFFEHAVKRQ